MHKLTKAEAGKIGGEKSKIISAQKKQERINIYNENPSICRHCQKPLAYEHKHKNFCDHSCSASFHNNAKRVHIEWICEGCGKRHSALPHRVRKFCDHKCQRAVTKQNTFDRLKQGLVTNRGVMRKVFIREFGHKCFECGLSSWRDHPIPLEIDHIDGNAGNNSYTNLRLICPNCHGITTTWKGRNKGNGRAARGLPLG